MILARQTNHHVQESVCLAYALLRLQPCRHYRPVLPHQPVFGCDWHLLDADETTHRGVGHHASIRSDKRTHHGNVLGRRLHPHHSEHVHHLRALPQLCEDRIRRAVHLLQPPTRPNLGGRQTSALPHHFGHRLSRYPHRGEHRHCHPCMEHL